jgi:flagellar biosynthesis protein FlhF
MELKRILARDSRAANEKAIQLYGQDVLIISSQRLDNQTELIVAIDMDATVEAPTVSAESAKATFAREEAPGAFVPFSKLFQSASAFAPLESEEPVPSAMKSAPAAAPSPDVQADAHQARHESQRSQEIVELLRMEMAALRKEFSLSRQMRPWQDGLRLSPAIGQLSMAMSEMGMPAGLRALLTDSIQEFDSVEQAWPVMHSLLVSALSRPVMAVPEVGVHALCGPSGSGKTSMVGRLAYAAAQLHGAESQVMVSFADQRPGAWAQMQLLAAQSGVVCFRAHNSDMLRTLLTDLEGKTVWIDTCGTDFGAQAELLLNEHPKVLRHAVLPVDATVTSVQKILQNSPLNWSSLMLSKVDEAAFPWALIKGLSEQTLGVSCMAGGSRIDQSVEAFDAARLADLGLNPLLQFLPQTVSTDHLSACLPVSSHSHGANAQTTHLSSSATNMLEVTAVPASKGVKLLLDDDIEIPTLMGALASTPRRKRAANGTRALKVAHG